MAFIRAVVVVLLILSATGGALAQGNGPPEHSNAGGNGNGNAGGNGPPEHSNAGGNGPAGAGNGPVGGNGGEPAGGRAGGPAGGVADGPAGGPAGQGPKPDPAGKPSPAADPAGTVEAGSDTGPKSDAAQRVEPTVVPTDGDVAAAMVESGEALPLSKVAAIASADHPGEVLDARLLQVGRFLLYELKILSPDGRVVETVLYYARTGREARR